MQTEVPRYFAKYDEQSFAERPLPQYELLKQRLMRITDEAASSGKYFSEADPKLITVESGQIYQVVCQKNLFQVCQASTDNNRDVFVRAALGRGKTVSFSYMNRLDCGGEMRRDPNVHVRRIILDIAFPYLVGQSDSIKWGESWLVDENMTRFRNELTKMRDINPPDFVVSHAISLTFSGRVYAELGFVPYSYQLKRINDEIIPAKLVVSEPGIVDSINVVWQRLKTSKYRTETVTDINGVKRGVEVRQQEELIYCMRQLQRLSMKQIANQLNLSFSTASRRYNNYARRVERGQVIVPRMESAQEPITSSPKLKDVSPEPSEQIEVWNQVMSSVKIISEQIVDQLGFRIQAWKVSEVILAINGISITGSPVDVDSFQVIGAMHDLSENNVKAIANSFNKLALNDQKVYDLLDHYGFYLPPRF